MKRDLPSPSELRAMFGSNLRKLSKDYPSISELARQLGINRTQFNRYLSGESFPRPDVLARVCAFFDVDARVLLESVDEISSGEDPVANSYLRDYVGAGAANVPNALFPSGFYRFSRRSFMRDDRFMIGMVHVSRSGQSTFLRGYESAEVMGAQGGRVDGPSREYRGVVMQQEDGIVFMAARRNSMTSSFSYLSRVASFENNFWSGYITRTVPETPGSLRATRMVFEFVGEKATQALPAARSCGFVPLEGLHAFHSWLLKPNIPFS